MNNLLDAQTSNHLELSKFAPKTKQKLITSPMVINVAKKMFDLKKMMMNYTKISKNKS